MYTWKETLAKGQKGEKVIKDYFESIGYNCSFLSIKNQKKYGFDILAKKDIESLYIEVKTEYYAAKSNNIFFETKVDGKLGWCLKYSPSSKVTICWYFPHSKEIALYPAKDLCKISYNDFPKKEVLNNWGRLVRAEGHLIPISYLKNGTNINNIKWINLMES